MTPRDDGLDYIWEWLIPKKCIDFDQWITNSEITEAFWPYQWKIDKFLRRVNKARYYMSLEHLKFKWDDNSVDVERLEGIQNKIQDPLMTHVNTCWLLGEYANPCSDAWHFADSRDWEERNKRKERTLKQEKDRANRERIKKNWFILKNKS